MNYEISFLGKEDIEIYTKKLIESFDVDNYEFYLDDNLRNYHKGNIFLGANLITNNLLIGGICFEKKPIYRNEIYIEGLFVDKKYRNQGVATNILNYIVQNKNEIFKRNKIDLYLFCEEYLKEFYEKNNFYEVDTFMDKNLEKVLRMDRNI